MLDKCLNVAHELIITQIDFFKVQLLKKKKKIKSEEIQSESISFR